MPKVVSVHPQHCQRPPPSIMLEVVCVHLQHYAQSCPPAPQSGLVIVGGRVTSRRLGKEGKEGRGKKKGEVGEKRKARNTGARLESNEGV